MTTANDKKAHQTAIDRRTDDKLLTAVSDRHATDNCKRQTYCRIADKALSTVNDRRTADKALTAVSDRRIADKALSTVNDRRIADKALSTVNDRRIADKALSTVSDRHIAVLLTRHCQL